ncbi:MAG: hypothetical protein OSA48_11210, partial [Akkermansiaceae bacterium]|nr:hypothetical protein [Akkermansiaceae bacterium]
MSGLQFPLADRALVLSNTLRGRVGELDEEGGGSEQAGKTPHSLDSATSAYFQGESSSTDEPSL